MAKNYLTRGTTATDIVALIKTKHPRRRLKITSPERIEMLRDGYKIFIDLHYDKDKQCKYFSLKGDVDFLDIKNLIAISVGVILGFVGAVLFFALASSIYSEKWKPEIENIEDIIKSEFSNPDAQIEKIDVVTKVDY